MNQKLHDSEAPAEQRQIAQILDATPDGVIVLAIDGRIQSMNRRARELFEIDWLSLLNVHASPPGRPARPIDRSASALTFGLPARRARVPGLDLATLLASRGVAMDTAGAARLVRLLEAPHEDGEGDVDLRALRRVLHWAGQATLDASGRVVGFTLTFRDVTHDREVSRLKSEFVSFVTHQLRTPLAGMRWILELAERAEAVDEARAWIRDARESTQRLVQLVNDLLDASRVESGQLPIDLAPTDLGELSEEVLGELRPLIEDKGHRVTIESVADLPRVLLDRRLMRQVILNLVSNAIKYTPDGGTIAVRVAHDPSHVRWRITDTGIGIPEAGQWRLFEKFYRADNAVALETEGTGLGLYLVRTILERFGGQVWCESEEHKGSTFEFVIPVRP